MAKHAGTGNKREITLKNNVAILVVFQPKGVPRSIFSCEHLITQRYSPFIICYSTVKTDDKIAFLARAAPLLERKNFGYVFGAYRHGIRLLHRADSNPDC